MIFVGDRCPKNCDDTVAEDLRDGAVVAVHRRSHESDRRVEYRLRAFGIRAFDQLKGTAQIGKHHRDQLALALDGGARAQDAVREVSRRVRLDRRYAARERNTDRTAAAAAEVGKG